MAVLRKFSDAWAPLDVVSLALVTLAAGGLGLLLARFLPSWKRFFAGHAQLDRRVSQRAAEAFVSEEVFKTRGRTGILLFVSIFERRVLVLGDAGINAKVDKGDWHDIVRRIVAGIRERKPAEGLIDGIRQCGALLEKHHVRRAADDRDELPDTLRTSDS
jgi:putative membrane protein